MTRRMLVGNSLHHYWIMCTSSFGSEKTFLFFLIADLPTYLYLTASVWKLTSSMDIHAYFSKYGQRVSGKHGNPDTQGALLCEKDVQVS